MTSAEPINLLHSFLNGMIDLAEFDDRLGDIIFELCQSPEMTDEKAALSRIQLAIHELDDGIGEPVRPLAHDLKLREVRDEAQNNIRHARAYLTCLRGCTADECCRGRRLWSSRKTR